MTIHTQTDIPTHAQIGDAWTDGKSFKRVLSRGGAWENVNLGEKHKDEVDHGEQQEQRAETKQRDGVPGTELPEGADSTAQGDGDDGTLPAVREDGTEDPDVDAPAGHETADDVSPTGEPLTSTGPIEASEQGRQGRGGFDGNGSPVV